MTSAPDRIYLDHNATTPLLPEVRAEVLKSLEIWGNPSSIHWAGRAARALMAQSRNLLAGALDASPLELIFTSGGTESNNWALTSGFAHQLGHGRRQILISSVEHPSVVRAAEHLEQMGAEVDRVPVDASGVLDFEYLQSKISSKTALVSVMMANNETGVLFPIREIAELAHAHGALMHTDAVQGFGKVNFSLKKLDVDFASISAHKFYALKGLGAMYVKRGTALSPFLYGGGQERKRRGGTENIVGIAALGAALALAQGISAQYERLKALRDKFEDRCLQEFLGVRIVGHNQKRLPNTSLLLLDGVDGESLLMNLDILGMAVSTGAACSSGNPEPSPVLLAMGYSRLEAQTSLRVSLGWETTEEQMEQFFKALQSVVRRLRKLRTQVSSANEEFKEHMGVL